MKVNYIDTPRNSSCCVGVIMKDGETVVFTGATVYSMSLCVKQKEYEEYEKFARDYDIKFIFDDDVPVVNFYTVPRIDIAAVDSDGGFIASVGQTFDLQESMPIVYISKELECYLITEDSTKFLKLAPCWKENVRPYDGVKFYSSIEEARKDFDIQELESVLPID